MFFLQLRQLMWKNFIIRKRSKVRTLITFIVELSKIVRYEQVRLIAELVWPIFLFSILALVRTKGLKTSYPECTFVCSFSTWSSTNSNFIIPRFPSRKSFTISWSTGLLAEFPLHNQQRVPFQAARTWKSHRPELVLDLLPIFALAG